MVSGFWDWRRGSRSLGRDLADASSIDCAEVREGFFFMWLGGLPSCLVEVDGGTWLYSTRSCVVSYYLSLAMQSMHFDCYTLVLGAHIVAL